MKKIGGDKNTIKNTSKKTSKNKKYDVIYDDKETFDENTQEKVEMDINSKIFYTPFDNSKGFKIGDFRIIIDKKKIPYLSTDQVDHYLYNLFKYVQEVPTADLSSIIKRKNFNEKFFEYHLEKLKKLELVKNKPSQGGYYKKTKVRKSRGKKSIKNRTRKNRM